MRSKKILLAAFISAVACVVSADSLTLDAFIEEVTAQPSPTPSPTPAPAPTRYSELPHDERRQVDCLAENIYHESKSEPVKGQQAVALVTMNRVADARFPKDVCAVVKQRTKNKQGKTVCQFSWHCSPTTLNRNNKYYREALRIATHIYMNYETIEDFTRGSLYFHAVYVNPGWNLTRTSVIGRHIFYKERKTRL